MAGSIFKSLVLSAALLSMVGVRAQKEKQGSFATTLTYKKSYGYVLQSPGQKKDKNPLIVFLHGSGERGSDLEKVKSNGPLKYSAAHRIDAFILAPQCPDDEYWDVDALFELIQKIKKENSIDPNRIYLTGLSMGGWGAWNLAIAHPEVFAALVPICGFVDRVPMLEKCKLANLPIKVFHGLLDDVVTVDYSIAIYKRIKSCPGAQIQLTIFDDANHDSWTRVYDDPGIYEWMLRQTKTANAK